MNFFNFMMVFFKLKKMLQFNKYLIKTVIPTLMCLQLPINIYYLFIPGVIQAVLYGSTVPVYYW